jgi:multiple sugar transport system permease protein
LPSKSSRRRAVQRTVTGYLFLSPAIVFYLIFLIIPVGMSVYISFRKWNMLVPLSSSTFIGLKNYQDLFRDELFLYAVKNTVIWATGTVFLGMLIALVIALLILNIRWAPFWRFLVFAPVVTPLVAVARIWGSGIYKTSGGMLNSILAMWQLPPQHWLADSRIALFSIMAVAIWASIGSTVIVFTAGLKGIPDEYYQAAKIDGANSWHEFRHVTLPLLKPTILFLSVTGLIGAWQAFDLVFQMGAGGTHSGVSAMKSIILLNVYLYQTAFQNLRMGRATAGAFVLFLIILCFTFVVLRVLREGGVESYE